MEFGSWASRARARARIAVRIFVTSLLLLLGISCGVSPPRLVTARSQLNGFLNPERGERWERLSVFVRVVDDDGFEDLESVSIFHEESDLVWELTPDIWEYRKDREEVWIGSNKLVSADGSPLPRGEYRVEVRDLAGYYAEERFSLTGPPLKLASLPFPTATGTASGLTNGGGEPVVAIFYGINDQHLFSGIVEPGAPIRLENAAQRGERATSVYLYRFLENEGIGLMSGPYEMPLP